jgi:adenosylcobinamide kinase / adenosylcobinamide-phosphate guanylyltransferase
VKTLVLGGARSGKSRRAEQIAASWLETPGHEALLLATAWAGDAEMAARIERHRLDRAQRIPQLACEETPIELPLAIRRHAAPQRLLVVDCLTLWLTQCRMPPPGQAPQDASRLETELVDAVAAAAGPIVLVSNEIGLGLLPMGREAREVVDALGHLHQRLAKVCDAVSLMVAGLPLHLKEAP